MISKILARLGLGDSYGSAEDFRRRHVRHEGADADVVIGEAAYPIRDWSTGGMFVAAKPDESMRVGDAVDFTLRFRFPTEAIEITETGRILRTGVWGMAVEFTLEQAEARRRFARVIDNYHAKSFVDSHAA